MAGRRLTTDEQARWAEVARTVRIMQGKRAPPNMVTESAPSSAPVKAERVLTRAAPQQVPVPSPRSPVPVLDSSWEKRVRSGTLMPDMSIDLHGHNLSMAHLQLNRALAGALAQGVRTLLVVTGKPRQRNENSSHSQRGAIRAEIGHWLQTSPHADAIASVRVAHPRHGGDGALYVILRRKK
jgi:DNA-nicking Smr family endonuclease